MSVNWKIFLLKLEHQNACYRLRADPFEPGQLRLDLGDGQSTQVLETDLPSLLPHPLQDAPDPRRLRRRQAPAPYRVLQPLRLRVKNLLPGGECGLEVEEGPLGVGIGGVLREEGADEAVEDGLGREFVGGGAGASAVAGEVLGEAVESEEAVADGEALVRGWVG